MRPVLVVAVLLCPPCLGYFKREEHWVNGHLYSVTVDQPFFRVQHPPHVPIPDVMKDRSLFNHSMVPDEDVYQAHNWTDRERKYFDCLDLLCVCPFFNGSVIDAACVLPNGKELQRAKRKEYRLLSDVERTQIEKAFNAMYHDGTYHRIGRIHKYAGIHSGPAFYTWHREFLKRFELILRTYLPMGSNLGIPFWDSTREGVLPEEKDSVFFSEYLLGDTDPDGLVVKGPYANWTTMDGDVGIHRALGEDSAGELFNEARIDVVLDQAEVDSVMAPSLPLASCTILENITLDDRMLEYSHDYVHYFVGGDFFPTHSSVNDVIFWFHHSFMDLLWEMWRQKQQSRGERETQYPRSDPSCFPEIHFAESPMREMESMTNRAALSNNYTDYIYSYDGRPRCTRRKPDCGSRFLFCDTLADPPRCLSKVKLGGNCTAFERTDVCFDGRCRGGRCTLFEAPHEAAEVVDGGTASGTASAPSVRSLVAVVLLLLLLPLN